MPTMVAGTKHKQEEEVFPARLYSNKSRSRPSVVEARVDPIYGQRSALPGLDNDNEPTAVWDEDGLPYDDGGMDALSYLRSVRQEATRIPNILVAPKDASDASSYDDYADDAADTGYYEDGVYYTSGPIPTSSNGTEEAKREAQIDPQLVYFDSIIRRFEILRAQLQQTPPPEAVAKLDSTHPTTPPAEKKKTHMILKWWRGQIQSTNPAPVQIASMDKSAVLRALLSLTGGKLLRSGDEIKPSVSLWAWALLAKLPARGELSSEEIGVVRELGKRAVLVGTSLSGNNDWQEEVHEFEAGLDEEDEEDEGTYINEEEIKLDIDESFDSETESSLMHSYAAPSEPRNGALQIGPQLPTELGYTRVDESKFTGDNSSTTSPGLVNRDTMATSGNLGQQEERGPSSPSHGQPSSSTVEEEKFSLDGPQQDSEEAQLNAAKAQILARLDSEYVEQEVNLEPEVPDSQDIVQDTQSSKANTRATIDMIITVAGEMYGQRDLLEFRPAWTE